MELRVFDKTVQPLGAIDELASLLWHTKYFDVGTFSLLAPVTDNNSRLLVEGNLITKHDEKKEVKTADGGVWRRAAQITYVHITKDENGLEQLEAQGYMLSWWLNKRCIYPQIVATGTNQYEVVSIFKNMALCGLPVKKVWEKVREFLAKYTDELPDTDELDGDSTTGNVEEHRTQER